MKTVMKWHDHSLQVFYRDNKSVGDTENVALYFDLDSQSLQDPIYEF